MVIIEAARALEGGLVDEVQEGLACGDGLTNLERWVGWRVQAFRRSGVKAGGFSERGLKREREGRKRKTLRERG